MERAHVRTSSEVQTIESGRELAEVLAPGDVILLSGDLGAGKTAFAKGVALGLDIREPVTSPTFNILLVHEGRLTLNHFDLYRLERAAELEDIDYFGTLESGGVSLVEWGDRFAESRPDEYMVVDIEIVGDVDRTIAMGGHGARGNELIRAWTKRIDEAEGRAGKVVGAGAARP